MSADKLSMPHRDALALKRQLEAHFPTVIQVTIIASQHTAGKCLRLYHYRYQRTLVVGSQSGLASVLDAWGLDWEELSA